MKETLKALEQRAGTLANAIHDAMHEASKQNSTEALLLHAVLTEKLKASVEFHRQLKEISNIYQ